MYHRYPVIPPKPKWKYFFTKKGAPMSDEEAIVPVQNWDTSAKCVKCDQAESGTPGLKYKWKNGGNCVVNDVEVKLPENFEYLHCACLNCGYQWVMQTQDAEDRAKAEKEAAEEAAEEPDEEETEPKVNDGLPGHARRRVVKGGA